MLALIAIGFGVSLGYASGGRLRHLTSMQLKSESWILALFVTQALARGVLSPFLGEFTLVVWGACALTLAALIVREMGRPGVALAWLGLLSNAAVILVNGGMPVVPPPTMARSSAAAVDASFGFYLWADERAYFAVLGDVLPLGSSALASLGDVLLAVGIVVLLVSEMSPADRQTPCSSSD